MNFPVSLVDAPHVIVTRFSVPRTDDAENSPNHADDVWIEGRLELFRGFFVPSIARFDVPVVLLCSSTSAPGVSAALADLEWLTVVVQNDWYGGWVGSPDQTLTRMDSDDAIHERWFDDVDAAPENTEVSVTRAFLRFDIMTARLCAYSRSVPSPLAAFKGGQNPYRHNHANIEGHYRTHRLEDPYLLQIFHGRNISTRRPSWYRRRLPLDRLRAFGITNPHISASKRSSIQR